MHSDFGPITRAWFSGAFAAPTPAQSGAWTAIAAGRHSLVVAPTGSGKTLAAFLWSLDRLAAGPPPAEPGRRCRVLYVSPLKALAVDVERNLRTPLTGMRQAALRLGLAPPQITVAMRTGDTPAQERRAFIRQPPDILITTPESLFLLLTSSARESLRGVETVIVDEIHAVCATKRGAHLAVCLERLDALLTRPAQRIGLSATVRPIEETARFLGGAAAVEIVAPPATKTIEVQVQVPVPDMTDLQEQTPQGQAPRHSIWPAVEERILDLIERHRSTIVFVNARRGAERLCARLNELAHERATAPVELLEPAAPSQSRAPAQIMAQSGIAGGAPPVVARAHHGSVSKEERMHIEEALKSGQLPAVVATSSLELGIDMGAVDLVIQVEAPPSVSAGLQRIGRAGHQVGAVSRGVVFPKHRGDLVACAVVAQRMAAAAIEELHYPRNPLDVLAQQIVAMVAMDPWPVAELAALVRRAAPYAGLPRSALEATLDMLAGRYPSTAFAELRPRVIWDRDTDLLTARPGAQRLAVTSGGTIPDRGLFGVFLAGAARPVRVGELDEEMVYESRVGDVFLLGSSSWRIEDITPDRVLVSPAPGQAARMPFWKGDAVGRPVELGRAIGAQLRRLTRLPPAQAHSELLDAGLDEWAAQNLVSYLTEQREASRVLPDDRTILVERFRDELGDWRLAVHCVLGARVNAPWALAIGRRLAERYGVDAQVMPADDGIVIRLPDVLEASFDTDAASTVDHRGHDQAPPAVPGAELVLFDPDEIASIVEESVGASALFAARFRECAARALLLPRRDPGKRSPLWQQRQRAAQLLDVARDFADFPITLEAARECLQDVYDVPALVELMRELAGRAVRVVEVETPRPSPFARSLLFGYVGAFLYESDAPLAERRAAALALDSALLGELLGRVDLRELLDPAVVAHTAQRLQWLTDDRRPRDAQDAADLLRMLGDLSAAEAEQRGLHAEWLAELVDARRAILVRVAGQERYLAVEDAGRYRDALGVALPVGLAAAFIESGPDPLADLIGRYARTHGPFLATQVATRFGLGVSVVEHALHRLVGAGRVSSGEFTPLGGAVPEPAAHGQTAAAAKQPAAPSMGVAAGALEWCDVEVLRILRRRSLAALRREIEPVPAATLGRFLPAWQGVGSAARGVEAVAAAIEGLQGLPLPASAVERLILPARVADYSPAYLDELTASGELLWAGAGAIGGSDGWIAFAFADTAPLLLAQPATGLDPTPLHVAVLHALDAGQALFLRPLAQKVITGDLAATTEAELLAAVWDLVWAGLVANDTLAPLRARLAGGGAHKARPVPTRARYRRTGTARIAGWSPAGPVPRPTGSRQVAASAAGRWYLLPPRDPDPTRRAAALTDAMLDRHGVLTRGAVVAEGPAGGFAGVYPVLSALEERGAARRGYFVEGLGAAQFAVAAAVERLRAMADRGDPAGPAHAGAARAPWLAPVRSDPVHRAGAMVLAATDPANPYGAALPWPTRAVESGDEGPAPAQHRAGRKAGALVVLVDGDLALYVERGGHTLLSFLEDPDLLAAAAKGLADAVHTGALGVLSVQRADGAAIHTSPMREALAAAGFRVTPRGLRLRG